MHYSLTIGALIIGCLLVGGAFLLTRHNTVLDDGTASTVGAGTAVQENGIQYVDIFARGGYTPKRTRAEAGKETVLRVKTENTFDCSSALVIPALDYDESLTPSGTALIPIPADKAQGTLEGLCSMGMYRFSIAFE